MTTESASTESGRAAAPTKRKRIPAGLATRIVSGGISLAVCFAIITALTLADRASVDDNATPAPVTVTVPTPVATAPPAAPPPTITVIRRHYVTAGGGTTSGATGPSGGVAAGAAPPMGAGVPEVGSSTPTAPSQNVAPAPAPAPAPTPSPAPPPPPSSKSRGS